MHSTIIKLSTEPIFNERLDKDDIYPEDMDVLGIDYCGDEEDDEYVFDTLERMLAGVVAVDRDAHTLTLLEGAADVVEKEMEKVRQMIAGLTPHALATDKDCARYKVMMAMRRYRDYSTMFYMTGCLEASMDFVSNLLNDYYGKKLYVINGIDYHY